MQKENVETIINTCHSKLDLESSTHAVAGNKQPTWKIPYQVRDDVFINNGAFTLIELLVVVLIIGILAAIALPQYQKAVVRTETMQTLSLVRALAQAGEEYYLRTGTYPTKFDDMDVQIPGSWTQREKIYTYNASDSRSNGKYSIVIERSNSSSTALHMGKLSGPYRGTGFSYFWEHTSAIPQHKLLCSELFAHTSYPFTKNSGDFCVKLFHGTLVWPYDIRLYTLP